MVGWARDLGTTNTGIARWDDQGQVPRLLELPNISQRPGSDDPLEAPNLVPSAVHVLEEPSLVDRLGQWRPPARHFLVGRQAWIGRPAMERNLTESHKSFAPSFKRSLGEDAVRTLAQVGNAATRRDRWRRCSCASSWSKSSARAAAAFEISSSPYRSTPTRPIAPSSSTSAGDWVSGGCASSTSR